MADRGDFSGEETQTRTGRLVSSPLGRAYRPHGVEAGRQRGPGEVSVWTQSRHAQPDVDLNQARFGAVRLSL